jgi:hypothetical protein
MKPPIPWNGFVFVWQDSDMQADRYRGDGVVGRLTHVRSTGHWFAYLREAGGAAVPTKPMWQEEIHDVARRALDDALDSLRVRVAGDQAWLAKVDEELGL